MSIKPPAKIVGEILQIGTENTLDVAIDIDPTKILSREKDEESFAQQQSPKIKYTS